MKIHHKQCHKIQKTQQDEVRCKLTKEADKLLVDKDWTAGRCLVSERFGLERGGDSLPRLMLIGIAEGANGAHTIRAASTVMAKQYKLPVDGI